MVQEFPYTPHLIFSIIKTLQYQSDIFVKINEPITKGNKLLGFLYILLYVIFYVPRSHSGYYITCSLHRLLLAVPVSQNFFVFDNIDSWESKGQVFCRVSQLDFV